VALVRSAQQERLLIFPRDWLVAHTRLGIILLVYSKARFFLRFTSSLFSCLSLIYAYWILKETFSCHLLIVRDLRLATCDRERIDMRLFAWGDFSASMTPIVEFAHSVYSLRTCRCLGTPQTGKSCLHWVQNSLLLGTLLKELMIARILVLTMLIGHAFQVAHIPSRALVILYLCANPSYF